MRGRVGKGQLGQGEPAVPHAFRATSYTAARPSKIVPASSERVREGGASRRGDCGSFHVEDDTRFPRALRRERIKIVEEAVQDRQGAKDDYAGGGVNRPRHRGDPDIDLPVCP